MFQNNLNTPKEELEDYTELDPNYKALDSLSSEDFNEEEYLKGLMLVVNSFRKSKGQSHKVQEYILAAQEVLSRLDSAKTININFDEIN